MCRRPTDTCADVLAKGSMQTATTCVSDQSLYKPVYCIDLCDSCMGRAVHGWLETGAFERLWNADYCREGQGWCRSKTDVLPKTHVLHSFPEFSLFVAHPPTQRGGALFQSSVGFTLSQRQMLALQPVSDLHGKSCTWLAGDRCI